MKGVNHENIGNRTDGDVRDNGDRDSSDLLAGSERDVIEELKLLNEVVGYTRFWRTQGKKCG